MINYLLQNPLLIDLRIFDLQDCGAKILYALNPQVQSTYTFESYAQMCRMFKKMLDYAMRKNLHDTMEQLAEKTRPEILDYVQRNW